MSTLFYFSVVLIAGPLFVELLVSLLKEKPTKIRVAVCFLSLALIAVFFIGVFGYNVPDFEPDFGDLPSLGQNAEQTQESGASAPQMPEESGGPIIRASAFQKNSSSARIVRIFFIASLIVLAALTLRIWTKRDYSCPTIDSMLANPWWNVAFFAFFISAVIIALSTVFSSASFPSNPYRNFAKDSAIVYIEGEENPPTIMTLSEARMEISEEGAASLIAAYQYYDGRGNLKYHLQIKLNADAFVNQTYHSKDKAVRANAQNEFLLKIRANLYEAGKIAKRSNYRFTITDRNDDLTHYQGQFSAVAQRREEKASEGWLSKIESYLPGNTDWFPKTEVHFLKETVNIKGTFDFTISD